MTTLFRLPVFVFTAVKTKRISFCVKHGLRGYDELGKVSGQRAGKKKMMWSCPHNPGVPRGGSSSDTHTDHYTTMRQRQPQGYRAVDRGGLEPTV